MARTKRPPAKKKGKGKAAATGSSSHEIPTANATTTGDTNEATSSGTANNSAPANTAAAAPLLSLAPATTSAPSATSASAPPPATTSTQATTAAPPTTTTAPTTTAAPDTTSAQAEPSQTPSHSKGPETRSSLVQKDRKDRKAAEAARSEAKSISDQPKSRPAKSGSKATTRKAKKDDRPFYPAKSVQAQYEDKDGEMWYEVVWEETWEREDDINKKAMDEWKEKLKDKNFDPEVSFSNPFPYKDKRRPAATPGPGQTSCPTIPLDNSNERNMGGETGQGATNAGDAGGHGNGDAGVVDLDEADDGDATHDGGQALGGLDSVSTAGREISAKEKPRIPLKRTRSVVDTGPDDAGGPSTAKAAEKEPEHVTSDSNCEPSSSGSPKPKRRGRPPRKSTASTQEEDSVVNDAPRTSRGRKGATTKEKAKKGGKK